MRDRRFFDNHVRENMLITCVECGHTLSDRASVCPNCGCPVSEMEKIEKEEIRVQKEQRELQLKDDLKKGIIIQTNLFGETNYIEKRYAKLQKQLYSEYEETEKMLSAVNTDINMVAQKYRTRFHSEFNEAIIKKYTDYFEYMKKMVVEYCTEISQILCEKAENTEIWGGEDVDEWKEYVESYYLTIDEKGESGVLNAVAQVSKIVQELIGRMEYDQLVGEIKKQTRGKVIGGGTSIKSMFQGMAVAGVMNAAYGGLYDIKNIWSNANAANKRRDKFMEGLLSDEFREYMEKAIESDIFAIYDVFYDVCNNYFERKFEGVTEKVDFSAVKRKFYQQVEECRNNKYEYDSSQIGEIIKQYLLQYPTEEYIYEEYIRCYGDEDKELEKLAAAFDINIDSIKMNYFKKLIEPLPQKMYGKEYEGELNKRKSYLGINIDLEEYVNAQNTKVVNQICNGDINNLSDLKNMIQKLEQINLEVARTKINELKKQIVHVENINTYQKYLDDMDEDSKDSILDCYKKIRRIQNPEAKERSKELLLKLFDLVTKQGVFAKKWFTSNMSLGMNAENDRKKIEEIYLKITDGSNLVQHREAQKKLKKIENTVYDIDAEVNNVLNKEIEISKALSKRTTRASQMKEQIEKQKDKVEDAKEYAKFILKSHDNLLDDLLEDCGLISAFGILGLCIIVPATGISFLIKVLFHSGYLFSITGKILILCMVVEAAAYFGCQKHDQRCDEWKDADNRADKEAERLKELESEYSHFTNQAEIQHYLQEAMKNSKPIYPLCRVKTDHSIINFETCDLLYFDETKIAMLNEKEIIPKDGKVKIMSCDDMTIRNMEFYDLNTFLQKIREIYGDDYFESAYLLFRGNWDEKGKDTDTYRNQKEEDMMKKKQTVRISRKRRGIVAGYGYAVILNNDNTVEFYGRKNSNTNYDPLFHIYKKELPNWVDIVSITIGKNLIVGLKKDGHVVMTGQRDLIADYENDIKKWTDIVSVSVGKSSVVGLTKKGEVFATGDCCIRPDIVDVCFKKIYAGEFGVYGIDSSGKLFCGESFDSSYYAQNAQIFTTKGWNSIVDVIDMEGNGKYIIGICQDKSLRITGGDFDRGFVETFKDKVKSWKNVKKLVNYKAFLFALRYDGRVDICSDQVKWIQPIKTWEQIEDIVMCYALCAGLKSDGTVVAVSMSDRKISGYENWTDIEKIAVLPSCIFAMQKNGNLYIADENGSRCISEDTDGFEI